MTLFRYSDMFDSQRYPLKRCLIKYELDSQYPCFCFWKLIIFHYGFSTMSHRLCLLPQIHFRAKIRNSVCKIRKQFCLKVCFPWKPLAEPRLAYSQIKKESYKLNITLKGPFTYLGNFRVNWRALRSNSERKIGFFSGHYSCLWKVRLIPINSE